MEAISKNLPEFVPKTEQDCQTRCRRLFRSFCRVNEIDVDGLLADVGGHVRRDVPVEVRGKEFLGGRQIFTQVGRVVDVAWADSPNSAEFGGQAIVKAAKFEVAHVINGAFGHSQVEKDRAGRVVELGVDLDGGGDKSVRAVELLNVFQVVAEANGIGGLARLGTHHFLQGVGRELVIARPLQALQLVQQAGSDGENHVDDRLVARPVLILGPGFLYDFRLGLAELRLQVSASVVDGQKLVLDQQIEPGARVFAVRKFLGGGFERGDFSIGRAGKLDLAHLNEDVGDMVVDGVDGPVAFACAQILDVPGD